MDYNPLPTLGLAKKAGRLAIGDGAVEAALQNRTARLVLLASDVSDNTRHRAQRLAEYGKCPLLTLPYTKEALGNALGRAVCAVAAITDVGFAASIRKKCGM